MTWVELTGKRARDNAQGGIDEWEEWKPNPLHPVRVYGWNGEDYPRMTISAYISRGDRYSTGDSYPSEFSVDCAVKLSADGWWGTVGRGTHGGVPVEFYDVAMELLKEAMAAFKNIIKEPDVPFVAPLWRLRDDDDDEDE